MKQLRYLGPHGTSDTGDMATLEAYARDGITAASTQQLNQTVAFGSAVTDVAHAATITQTDLLNRINSALSAFMTVSDFNATVGALATLNQTDAVIGDCVRVDWINQPRNGVGDPIMLDTTGRLTVSQIPPQETSTLVQRHPWAFMSPAAYNTQAVQATGTSSATGYTLTIPDPGFPYRIWLNGMAYLFGEQGTPQVNVVANNGTVVASSTAITNWPIAWGLDQFDRPPSPDLGGAGYWAQFEYTQGRGLLTSSNIFGPNGLFSIEALSYVGDVIKQLLNGQNAPLAQGINGGQYAIVLKDGGTVAQWVPTPGGELVETMNVNIRTFSSDAVTASDYQRIRVVIDVPPPQFLPTRSDKPPQLLIFGRVAADSSSYVMISLQGSGYVFGGRDFTVAPPTVQAFYVTSGGLPNAVSSATPMSVPIPLTAENVAPWRISGAREALQPGDVLDFWFGTPDGGINTYEMHYNGTVCWSVSGTGPNVGPNNRNWGWGGLVTVPRMMDFTGRFYLSPSLKSIEIFDPEVPYTSNDYYILSNGQGIAPGALLGGPALPGPDPSQLASVNFIPQALWLTSGNMVAQQNLFRGSTTLSLQVVPDIDYSTVGADTSVTLLADPLQSLQVVLLPAQTHAR